MTYDEFGTRLRQLKTEFKKSEGRELETIVELESFLTKRLVTVSRNQAGTRKLKSLRGIIP